MRSLLLMIIMFSLSTNLFSDMTTADDSIAQLIEQELSGDAASTSTEFNYWNEFLQMILSLGTVVIILLFVAWFLRRFINKKVLQGNQSNEIKIIERRMLSPKSTLYLLEVKDKLLLVSDSANGGTRILLDCTKSAGHGELDALEVEVDERKPTSHFSQLLKKLKQKK